MKISYPKFLMTFSTLLGLLLPTALLAAAPAELVGKYGFDWLHPEKAKCLAITEKNLAGAQACKHHKEGDTGSFTGKADFYSCKVSPKVEYMIYNTQARCKEELETMESNAP